MKNLNNDPSRNVNAVSGMWVRLRKDNSKYDVRYVNARLKRIWRLSETSAGTSWNVQAKGEKKYAELLDGMKASQSDLEHGWFLVPDNERKAYGFTVPVLTGMDAKSVSGITVADFESRWTCENERFTTIDLGRHLGYLLSDRIRFIIKKLILTSPLAFILNLGRRQMTHHTLLRPMVNSKAVTYATMPDLMTAKECPALQGMGHIRYFRTSKGRKVAYVASANGKCVVAYRARYERGSDVVLETAVAEYVKSLGFAA